MTLSMVGRNPAAWLALIGLSLAGGAAAADGFSTPPGMTCEETVVVRYHAGPRWSHVDAEIAAHLDFMRAQMRRGTILAAGPFHDRGGLEIHRGADVAAVATLVDTDPLVRRRVVTYSLEPWWMCRPAGL